MRAASLHADGCDAVKLHFLVFKRTVTAASNEKQPPQKQCERCAVDLQGTLPHRLHSAASSARARTFFICSAMEGPRLAPQVGLFTGAALPGRLPAPLSAAACSNIFNRAASDIHWLSPARAPQRSHTEGSTAGLVLGASVKERCKAGGGGKHDRSKPLPVPSQASHSAKALATSLLLVPRHCTASLDPSALFSFPTPPTTTSHS